MSSRLNGTLVSQKEKSLKKERPKIARSTLNCMRNGASLTKLAKRYCLQNMMKYGNSLAKIAYLQKLLKMGLKTKYIFII